MTQVALTLTALFLLWFGVRGWKDTRDEMSGAAIGLAVACALAVLVA